MNQTQPYQITSTHWFSGYTFSAKEKDEESGYSYFGARYYDSDISVWLSVDPLADAFPSISSYAYCNNNPIMYIDLNGMEAESHNPKPKLIHHHDPNKHRPKLGHNSFNHKISRLLYNLTGTHRIPTVPMGHYRTSNWVNVGGINPGKNQIRVNEQDLGVSPKTYKLKGLRVGISSSENDPDISTGIIGTIITAGSSLKNLQNGEFGNLIDANMLFSPNTRRGNMFTAGPLPLMGLLPGVNQMLSNVMGPLLYPKTLVFGVYRFGAANWVNATLQIKYRTWVPYTTSDRRNIFQRWYYHTNF